MWMGKIGAKSAAFINHKPFHPGNLENLEKVWAAEEKQKQDQHRQKELEERREQEVKIQELRQTLRRKEMDSRRMATLDGGGGGGVKRKMAELHERLCGSSGIGLAAGLNTFTKTAKGEGGLGGDVKSDCSVGGGEGNNRERARVLNQSLVYKENVLLQNHSTVWGSYYDRDKGLWGFACCHVVGDKHCLCASKPAPASRDGEGDGKRDGGERGGGGKKKRRRK
eukprot:GHVQ01007315.1.p1 GENE.GHVQ01007315.1~~GHVQ01007315.1.p1  ORF type:complete len:224 (-),score=58.05 GHVQ01007315.1:460-1131(-)